MDSMTKDKACLLLLTIAGGMRPGTQREALKAVSEWMQNKILDDIPDDPEERKALELKIETSIRDCMTDKQRMAAARFYLEDPEMFSQEIIEENLPADMESVFNL